MASTGTLWVLTQNGTVRWYDTVYYSTHTLTVTHTCLQANIHIIMHTHTHCTHTHTHTHTHIDNTVNSQSQNLFHNGIELWSYYHVRYTYTTVTVKFILYHPE